MGLWRLWPQGSGNGYRCRGIAVAWCPVRAGLGCPKAGTVAPWGGPGSHLLSWLAGADAMIVIDAAVTRLEAGDQVEVWLLG